MRVLAKKIVSRLRPSAANPSPNPNSDEFEVDNWLISDFILSRLVPIVGVHPYPLNELVLMVGAICRFRPRYVFEWGTNVGVSARIFFETAKRFNIQLDIHSIDLPNEIEHVEHPGRSRGKLVKGKKGVFLHLGDGLSTSLELYRSLPADSSVLFFVDGDHSYASVKRELDAITKCVVAPKVLLHDTFLQSAESGYNVGPNQAVRDVLASLEDERRLRVLETRTGLPGMTLIY